VLANQFHLLLGALPPEIFLAAQPELIGYVLLTFEPGIGMDEWTVFVVAKLVNLGGVL
jgi:hypothetical protein